MPPAGPLSAIVPKPKPMPAPTPLTMGQNFAHETRSPVSVGIDDLILSSIFCALDFFDFAI